METIKKNQLLAFFVTNLIIFNILFFLKDVLLRFVYKSLDLYSQCPPDSVSCDVGSYTNIDDVITGLFAISILASAVSAAILVSRVIEKSWHKRGQRNKPRPRQPLDRR